MILEIDIGNTRIKWRRLRSDQVVESGVITHRGAELVDCWPQLGALAPELVRVASVSSPTIRDSLAAYCLAVWGLRPCYAVATPAAAGVTNAYRQPGQLGIDRWLALLAARRHFPGRHCLVVDSGSATTFDLLRADGCHLGGYIVPGLQMMQRALYADTAAVKVPELMADDQCMPGQDTGACVGHGLPLMLVGLCHQALTRFSALVGAATADIVVIITGGDAGYLQVLLVNAVHIRDLVLDGLALCELREMVSGLQ